jgi:hypothetical protein
MGTEPPPSRYKVIEKDGRLITVDTQAESDPFSDAPAASAFRQLSHATLTTSGAKKRSLLLAVSALFTETGLAADGRRRLRTHRFYDPNAPRLLRISDQQAKVLGGLGLAGFVLALILLVLLMLGRLIPVLIITVVIFQILAPSLKRALAAILADATEDKD